MSGVQVFLRYVAQALMPAASALMPTPAFCTMSPPPTSVETSLDTAGTSALRHTGPAAGSLSPMRMAEVAGALRLTLDL